MSRLIIMQRIIKEIKMKRISIISILILIVFLLSPYINAQQGEWYTIITYDGLNRIQYVGKAVPGSATADELWQIMLVTYEGVTTRISTTTYANGDATHKWIWDNRAAYPYS